MKATDFDRLMLTEDKPGLIPKVAESLDPSNYELRKRWCFNNVATVMQSNPSKT